ncbi:MAG: GIY-YIG nuclease family protein [Salinivirgaceae bacterium]|nr:GIY-YIG nuclease family protein [Salinivirgaceae bacterium]
MSAITNKTGYIYILTTENNKVMYIGVTSNLVKRVYEHKTHVYKGFTSKYNVTKLVYFEEFPEIEQAILREKQLKKWHREWKNQLVESMNPKWKDLSEMIGLIME